MIEENNEVLLPVSKFDDLVFLNNATHLMLSRLKNVVFAVNMLKGLVWGAKAFNYL